MNICEDSFYQTFYQGHMVLFCAGGFCSWGCHVKRSTDRKRSRVAEASHWWDWKWWAYRCGPSVFARGDTQRRNLDSKSASGWGKYTILPSVWIFQQLENVTLPSLCWEILKTYAWTNAHIWIILQLSHYSLIRLVKMIVSIRWIKS